MHKKINTIFTKSNQQIFNNMKASLLLSFSLFAMFSNTLANSKTKNQEYFICQFNSEITTSEYSKLSEQGFKIITRSNKSTVVYVIPKSPSAFFSTELKNRMTHLTKVDENGNHTPLKSYAEKESSSEFLNLFFNFI